MKKNQEMSMLTTRVVFSMVVLLAAVVPVTSAHAAPNAYAAAIMNDHPIGYWRLGESTGPTAADSSGNLHGGTYSGGLTFGQPGFHPPGDTAVLFHGATLATGRIVIPNTATLNPPRITMEAKIRWDGPIDDIQQRILEKESFAGITQYG